MILTGFIVLGCLAAVFVVGIVVGRTAVARRQVDRILDRELRHRVDPQRAADIRAKFMPLPTERTEDATRPPISAAEPRTPAMPGLSTEEAMSGAEGLSAALNDAAQYGLPERLIGRCGSPVEAALGDARTRVPCLLRPGHDGRCS